MESLFIQFLDVCISISKNWHLSLFCGPGSHICPIYLAK